MSIRKARFALTHADFMEPEGSLPYSQQPIIGSYPEPAQSSPRAPIYSLGISFNLTLQSSSSSKWSLYFRLTHQNSVCISLLTRTCYMPHSSHPPWLFHLNNIWWAVNTWSSSPYCFLHSPVTPSLSGPNISLSTLFSDTLSPRSCPDVTDQVLRPHDRK